MAVSMPILTDLQMDILLRQALQATDPVLKLQLIQEAAAQSLAAGADQTTVRNVFATEVARRNALPPTQRHGGLN